MTAWQFAVPDWWERMQAGRSLLPSLPLDEAPAARAVDLFNRIRLPDVEGQPQLRDAAGDWFRDVVRAIFGSLDPLTGVRQVPGVFGLVPKKNSKTTNSAALMLTALLMNTRPNAQFGLFGPTQEVADLAFSAAANMVKATPDYARLFDVKDYNKTILIRAGKGKGSWLKITTFDMQTATGGKYAGWLLDELHLLGKVHYAARVIGQLRGAASAIPEQFGVIITTQSDEPPAGVFKQELDYARSVRDGRVEAPSVLPLLYEFPYEIQVDPGKPWREVGIWRCVLPNLGRSVSLEVLRRDYAAARTKGEAEERRWVSQHLNVEIGLALHTDRWRGADHWEAAEDPDLTLEELLRRSEVVTVGIDGGGLDDLLAVVVLGREWETRRWLLWAKAWAHRSVLQQRQSVASQLNDFEADGDLVFVDDLADANAQLAEVVASIEGQGLLSKVGVDMYGCTDSVDALAQVGIVGDDRIVGISQGWKLNSIIKAMEVRVSNRTLLHGGQRLMSWCVGNAKVVPQGNAISITKAAAGTAKIDPLVAAFCAGVIMNANPEVASGFVYTGM